LNLITACPRSGTLYISNVMRRCGLDMPHEMTGKDGTVSYFFAVDASWYPIYSAMQKSGRRLRHHENGKRRDFAFKNFIHQMRDPIKCIASMCAVVVVRDWEWIEHHTGIHHKMKPKEVRAAKFWCKWNQLIRDQKPDMAYRVEDIDTVWPELANLTGIDLQKHPTVPDTSRTMHRIGGYRTAKPLTFDMLRAMDASVADELKDVAASFGYTI